MEILKDESREEEEELKDEEVSEDHDDDDEEDDDDDDDDEELDEEGDGGGGDEGGEEDGTSQCQGVQLQAADPSTERQKKKKSDAAASRPSRKCVPGIVYLGYIPPRIRPRHIRNLLASHGEIGRIFLQPEDHVVRRRKKKAGQRGRGFTEGWVEFRDKRVAKLVAASLNNTPIGAKRNSNFPGLWSMKYLHRFHWTHLSERLAYEQTVLQQRLRTEVSQAKRETNFYLSSVEKSHNFDKQQRKGRPVQDKQWQFSQRQTEDEIQNKKKKRNQHPVVSQSSQREKSHRHETKSQSNTSLLAKIFNSGQD